MHKSENSEMDDQNLRDELEKIFIDIPYLYLL